MDQFFDAETDHFISVAITLHVSITREELQLRELKNSVEDTSLHEILEKVVEEIRARDITTNAFQDRDFSSYIGPAPVKKPNQQSL